MEAVYWINPYALPKGADPKNWLTTYATCVVDGYKYNITESGRTYCAGKVKKED